MSTEFGGPTREDRADTGVGDTATSETASVGRATLIASLIAAVLSGGVVYLAGTLFLRYLGAAVGNGSPRLGYVAWVGMTVVFGLVFCALAAGQVKRGNSTTGYGFVYGIVLAVFAGLLAIPAMVTEITQWEFPLAHVGITPLAGFAIYGLVLGSLFWKLVNGRPLRPLFLVGRTTSTALASLVAGLVAGAVLVTAAPHHLVYFAIIVGAGGSVPTGYAVFALVSVVLGAGFAIYPARRVERQDLPGQSGFTLGAAYGLVLLVLGGAVIIPQFLGAATAFDPPRPRTGMLFAYLLFGIVMGVSYGVLEGSPGATPTFIRGRGVPVLGGSLLGGAAGVLFVFLVKPQPIYFLALSYLGVRPSWQLGVVVWFGLALLLGLAFVPLAARAVEYRIGLSRGLVVGTVYGAVLTGLVGAFLVPLLVRARGFPIDSPNTQPTIFIYLVFGVVFGGVYASSRKSRLAREEAPTSPAVGTTGQRAVVFGSLFGGAVSALVAYHLVSHTAILFMGSLVGRAGSVGTGFAVWLGLSLLLGTVFAVTVGPRLDDYTRSVDEFAEREQDVDETLGRYLDSAPLTTTATMAGFVYGVIVAVAVGAIAFPIAVNTVTGPGLGLPVPVLQPYLLLAFVVYGVIMGMGYGVVREF
jgi:uncharacterized membrane protein YagU involved in acid resistance